MFLIVSYTFSSASSARFQILEMDVQMLDNTEVNNNFYYPFSLEI